MIVNALLNALYNSIVFVINRLNLQDVQPVEALADTVTTVSGYFSALNTYLPMVSILAILSLVSVIEGYYLGHRIMNWAIRKIPTIS